VRGHEKMKQKTIPVTSFLLSSGRYSNLARRIRRRHGSASESAMERKTGLGKDGGVVRNERRIPNGRVLGSGKSSDSHKGCGTLRVPSVFYSRAVSLPRRGTNRKLRSLGVLRRRQRAGVGKSVT